MTVKGPPQSSSASRSPHRAGGKELDASTDTNPIHRVQAVPFRPPPMVRGVNPSHLRGSSNPGTRGLSGSIENNPFEGGQLQSSSGSTKVYRRIKAPESEDKTEAAIPEDEKRSGYIFRAMTNFSEILVLTKGQERAYREDPDDFLVSDMAQSRIDESGRKAEQLKAEVDQAIQPGVPATDPVAVLNELKRPFDEARQARFNAQLERYMQKVKTGETPKGVPKLLLQSNYNWFRRNFSLALAGNGETVIASPEDMETLSGAFPQINKMNPDIYNLIESIGSSGIVVLDRDMNAVRDGEGRPIVLTTEQMYRFMLADHHGYGEDDSLEVIQAAAQAYNERYNVNMPRDTEGNPALEATKIFRRALIDLFNKRPNARSLISRPRRNVQ